MRRKDFRSTLVVMSGLAFATQTGFVRQIVIADQFGAGRAADIFLVAFALPEFFFIALPIVLTPAFLPPFIACRQKAGEATAIQMGRWTTVALFMLLSMFTVVIGLSAPAIMDWLSPGFDLTERARAVQSSRLRLPAIDFMGLAILGGAVLQAYHRFARPAFITAAYNLTFVVVLMALPIMLLEDRAAWGVTLGAAAALALQWPVWRIFLSPLPAETNDLGKVIKSSPRPWVKQVAGLAMPLALGYAVHHLILIIDRSMATTLVTGSVAVLDYALRLAQVVGQLGALAVSTVLFPSLVEHIESKNLAGARRSLTDALRLIWMITLPACLGLMVLRTPLVRVLFEHGAFDRGDTQKVSQALALYALAVLADAICQPLWRVIYAQRLVWTVLAVNALQTVVRVLCNIIFIRDYGVNGLALSAIFGLSLQAFILGILVHRQLDFSIRFTGWREVGMVSIISIIAAIIGCLIASTLPANNPLVVLLVSGGAGALFYLSGLICLKILKKRRNLPLLIV